MAIFELLDREGRNETALGHFGSAVSELEKQPAMPWLMLADFKQTLTFAMIYLRERIVARVDRSELLWQQS